MMKYEIKTLNSGDRDEMSYFSRRDRDVKVHIVLIAVVQSGLFFTFIFSWRVNVIINYRLAMSQLCTHNLSIPVYSWAWDVNGQDPDVSLRGPRRDIGTSQERDQNSGWWNFYLSVFVQCWNPSHANKLFTHRMFCTCIRKIVFPSILLENLSVIFGV